MTTRVVESMTEDVEKKEVRRDPDTGRLLPGTAKPPGAGIQRGQRRQLGVQLQSMIHQALDMQPGGAVRYLAEQAQANPRAFLALLAKLVPRDLHVTQDAGPTMLELLTRADARVKDAEAKPKDAKPLPPTT